MKKATKKDPVKTRDEILSTAFHEILFNGFNGVSIDQIVNKTELTKGAFYYHFPTKQDLGYAIVDEVLKSMIMDRWIKPLAAYKNPLIGIVKTFKSLSDNTPDEHMVVGCPLNNLIQEMSASDPIFRKKLSDVLTFWILETEKYLVLAKERNYLIPETDTKHLATHIVAIEEVSFGFVKAMGDRKIYSMFYESLKNIIKPYEVREI